MLLAAIMDKEVTLRIEATCQESEAERQKSSMGPGACQLAWTPSYGMDYSHLRERKTSIVFKPLFAFSVTCRHQDYQKTCQILPFFKKKTQSKFVFFSLSDLRALISISFILVVTIKCLTYLHIYFRRALGPCYSKYDPLISYVSITGEFLRNVESHALPRPTETEAHFDKILR